MKCMTLRRCRLPLVAILVVPAAQGCDEAAATPADQLKVVTDAVETASQGFDVNAVLNVGNLQFNVQNAVARAFLSTAAIKLEYTHTNSSLPDPIGCAGCPDWPDSDTDPSFYQTYAANHHDTAKYPWVIFYVKHTTHNSTTSCGYRPGISHKGADNVVWTDPKQRWTFVYLTDIKQHEQSLCTPAATDQQLQNFVSHVVAHEYGHQRAGLTENDGSASTGNYHRGGVPKGRADVMVSPANVADWQGHSDPVFDSFGNERVGERFTCRGNLLTNQSVQ